MAILECHPVGELADALGIRRSDIRSRRSLQDFVHSDKVNKLMRNVSDVYLERRNSERGFPPIREVLKAGLSYYSPTLVPDRSINTVALSHYNLNDPGAHVPGAVYIARFAAMVVHHVETDRAAELRAATAALAWFPVHPLHKLAFAAALMYLLYPRLTVRYRGSQATPVAQRTLDAAYREALNHLASAYRCVRCGQDFPNIRASRVCRVCPNLQPGEAVPFARQRERQDRQERECRVREWQQRRQQQQEQRSEPQSRGHGPLAVNGNPIPPRYDNPNPRYLGRNYNPNYHRQQKKLAARYHRWQQHQKREYSPFPPLTDNSRDRDESHDRSGAGPPQPTPALRDEDGDTPMTDLDHNEMPPWRSHRVEMASAEEPAPAPEPKSSMTSEIDRLLAQLTGVGNPIVFAPEEKTLGKNR